jgi:hypothetical protein
MLYGIFYIDGKQLQFNHFPDKIIYYHLRDHIPYERSGTKNVTPLTAIFYNKPIGDDVRYLKGEERGPALYTVNRSPDDLDILGQHLNVIVGSTRFNRFYPSIGALCENYCPYKTLCDGLLNQSGKSLTDLSY